MIFKMNEDRNFPPYATECNIALGNINVTS